MMHCCAGVEVYEMILRTAEYDGQDVTAMRQDLTWGAKAKTSMHLLMGFAGFWVFSMPMQASVLRDP